MAKNLTEIETEARRLSAEDRARLIRTLLTTLEQEDDGDVEQIWLDEAERRLAADRSGDASASSGDEAFETILRRY